MIARAWSIVQSRRPVPRHEESPPDIDAPCDPNMVSCGFRGTYLPFGPDLLLLFDLLSPTAGSVLAYPGGTTGPLHKMYVDLPWILRRTPCGTQAKSASVPVRGRDNGRGVASCSRNLRLRSIAGNHRSVSGRYSGAYRDARRRRNARQNEDSS